MSCERWNEAILGMLYDEIDADERRALDAHLEGCAPCTTALGELSRVRTVLQENEPHVPKMPRVVVLREPARFRPALVAATLLSAALLAGAGAGAGYAIGRNEAAPRPNPVEVAATTDRPTALDPATEALVRREVEARLKAYEAATASQTTLPAAPAAGLTEQDLQAALAKFERKLNGARNAEMDYLLSQIEASEVRNTARIGQTNQALRYVALASNPNVSER